MASNAAYEPAVTHERVDTIEKSKLVNFTVTAAALLRALPLHLQTNTNNKHIREIASEGEKAIRNLMEGRDVSVEPNLMNRLTLVEEPAPNASYIRAIHNHPARPWANFQSFVKNKISQSENRLAGRCGELHEILVEKLPVSCRDALEAALSNHGSSTEDYFEVVCSSKHVLDLHAQDEKRAQKNKTRSKKPNSRFNQRRSQQKEEKQLSKDTYMPQHSQSDDDTMVTNAELEKRLNEQRQDFQQQSDTFKEQQASLQKVMDQLLSRTPPAKKGIPKDGVNQQTSPISQTVNVNKVGKLKMLPANELEVWILQAKNYVIQINNDPTARTQLTNNAIDPSEPLHMKFWLMSLKAGTDGLSISWDVVFDQVRQYFVRRDHISDDIRCEHTWDDTQWEQDFKWLLPLTEDNIPVVLSGVATSLKYYRWSPTKVADHLTPQMTPYQRRLFRKHWSKGFCDVQDIVKFFTWVLYKMIECTGCGRTHPPPYNRCMTPSQGARKAKGKTKSLVKESGPAFLLGKDEF